MSLDQATAVLNGKRIIALPKDIAEVKNAYEIYEMMESLNLYSVNDLLSAHGVMTSGLAESGCFRSGPVGVVDKRYYSAFRQAARYTGLGHGIVGLGS